MPVVTEKLKYPSILEAVCELRFKGGDSYTMIPGAMRERLQPKFPSYQVLPAAMIMGGIPEAVMTTSVPHHRFTSETRNALVQTGPRLLTVNVLPVYPTYEIFRELILFCLNHYRQVANPTEVVRIGLRYINHLRTQGGEQAMKELANVELSWPPGLPASPQETAAKLVFPYGNLGTLSLALAFPSRTAQGDEGALLDLDFYLADPQRFVLDDFASWLDRAHEIVYQAFVSTVSAHMLARLKGE